MPKPYFLCKPITFAKRDIITIDQVKEYLRINDASQDHTLKILIKSASLWIENQTRRSLLTKTYQCLYLSKTILEFPYLPLVSIESVVGFSDLKRENSTPIIDFEMTPESLKINFKGPWVEMTYTAGYGDKPQDLPADLVQAILLTVSYLYDLRTGNVDRTPIDQLIEPYRVRRL